MPARGAEERVPPVVEMRGGSPGHSYEARFVVDTARFGLGNGGHIFGDKLTDRERADVIESLKTL